MFYEEVIKNIILPPVVLVLLALLGLGISTMWRKLGLIVSSGSLIALLLCSLPAVTSVLMESVQREPVLLEQRLNKALKNVDAIVVLGGGRRINSAEYGQDTASEFTLERLRYAAWIAKRSGLPLIVSGGKRATENRSEAELMQDILQKEFLVIVDHVETNSRNTYENAQYTAKILNDSKLDNIALVTHAWHMPRAKKAFEHFGIKVTSAPTAFYRNSKNWRAMDFVPSANALLYSSLAFHEIIGEIWYDARYY